MFSKRLFGAKRFFSTQAKETVGFIGLGNMGGPMARNLAKAGYPLVVFDVNQQTAQSFKSDTTRVASSPKEVAAHAKKIVTMLPSSPHVIQVYTNDSGILSSVQAGSLLIDTSTIDPSIARDVANKAKQHKARMVDAPVSGGVLGAANATLTFMVGGDESDFESARDLLQHMGKNIVHCGGSGNGQVVKVCNNLVLGISMLGVSEAMNLGISMGMDAKLLAKIFSTSSARCWSVDTYCPVPGVMEGVPSSRGYSGGFGVDLMAKDLGLANSAANNVKAPLPLGSQALQFYNMISNQGLGMKDFSVVYDFLNQKKKQN